MGYRRLNALNARGPVCRERTDGSRLLAETPGGDTLHIAIRMPLRISDRPEWSLRWRERHYRLSAAEAERLLEALAAAYGDPVEALAEQFEFAVPRRTLRDDLESRGITFEYTENDVEPSAVW